MASESTAITVRLYPTLPLLDEPVTRDPKGINEHLRMNFDSIIGEPDRSAHTFQGVHTVATHVYHYVKLFIYRLLTTILGLPLMFLWGIVFGAYTFVMIWIMTPVRRLSQSLLIEYGTCVQTASDAIVAPVFRAIGLIRSSMRITMKKELVDIGASPPTVV